MEKAGGSVVALSDGPGEGSTFCFSMQARAFKNSFAAKKYMQKNQLQSEEEKGGNRKESECGSSVCEFIDQDDESDFSSMVD